MGCGASTDFPRGQDTISSVPPLPHDEVRYHREIESLEYISDAETVDEPSNFAKAVRIKAKCVVARVAHGITDDCAQFDEDIRETEPIFADEEFDFIRHWLDENTTALAGAAPAAIVEWDPIQAKQALKTKVKHAPDSSRTVATRVAPSGAGANASTPGRSPGLAHTHGTPQHQQQQSQHPHSLSEFVSPQDRTLTSPETQSSSALGTTGDNFVLDSTSSNARGTFPMPTATSQVQHQHQQQQQQHHEPTAAKYQVKTAAPLPPSPHHSQPAPQLDRHKTKPSLVKSPARSEDLRPLPGQMIEAQ